jgi:hypothetical protein
MAPLPFVLRAAARTDFRRAGLVGIALLSLLATPALAQNGDVSGIPPGPANANGLNGVIRDPSGIGNAAKMPPLPQQIAPIGVPSVAPLRSTEPAYTPRVSYQRWRHLPKRERQRLERAQVKENDRLLRGGLTSICRGC